MAYTADVSTGSKFTKNLGVLGAWGAFGVIVGMLVIVFVNSVTYAYLVPVALLAIILSLAQRFLPDASPPPSARIQWDRFTLGWSFIPLAHVMNFRRQTMYTKCLLVSNFFGGAAFKTIETWLFTYGLRRFGMVRQTCGLWILATFFTGGLTVAVGTRLVGANKGSIALMWLTPSFAIWMCIGPGTGITMWIGLAMLLPNHLVSALLGSLYYGQQPPARRAELAGLSNIADKVGGLFALAMASPLTVAWLKADEDGIGSTVPPPPMLQAIFDVLQAAMFYIAWRCYSHQDQTAVTVRKTTKYAAAPAPKEAPDGDAP